MKEKIVIFGIQKVADVIFDSIMDDDNSNVEVCGFCVDGDYLDSNEHRGLPLVGFDMITEVFPPQEYSVLVAIGYWDLNEVRNVKCKEVCKKGYKLASFVHSRSGVSKSAQIGMNCFIQENANVGCQSIIGNNTFIFSGATVSHHDIVGDSCWIASGSVIGGEAKIGSNCFLGIASIVGHEISVGKENFIGAGAKVTRNTEDGSAYIVPDTEKHRLSTKLFLKLSHFM